jgi:hypothetical protein
LFKFVISFSLRFLPIPQASFLLEREIGSEKCAGVGVPVSQTIADIPSCAASKF